MLYLLADTANPAFGPGDEMMESGKLLAASRAQVDAYTAAVLRQGEIKLDKIQNLERYQMEAREHAQSWQADVSTGLIAANTELISFANTFDSYYAPLYSLAGGITTGNNRAEFISGLETLVRQVRRQQDHTAQASKKLTSFTRNIHNDYGNFQDLVQQARSVYEGDKGELARLEELAKTLTDGMKKDQTIIAVGWTVVAVGSITILVGLLLLPTGYGVPILVGGMVATGGGAVTAAIATESYKAKAKELRETLVQISTIHGELAVLHAIETQFSSLSTANEQASQHLRAMENTWAELGTRFKTVIDSLKDGANPDAGIFLRAQLDAAKRNWVGTRESADLISRQLTNLPVNVQLDQAA